MQGSELSNPAKKNGTSWILWAVIIVVGFTVIKRLFGSTFSHIGDAQITEFDEDTISSLLESGGGDSGFLLPDDNSPVVIELPARELTDAEIVEISVSLQERYSTIAQSVADRLSSDVAGVFDTIAIVFSSAGVGGTVSQAALDLYFRALDVWAGRFDSTMAGVTEGIATIAAAQIEGINNAVECSETILVKEVQEEAQVTEDTYYTVAITNNSKGGFMGLNKRKGSSETRTTVKNFTNTSVRHIKYVPVCLDWQLDVTQLAGILAAGSLAIEMQYGLLTAVVNMAPNPEAFIIPAE